MKLLRSAALLAALSPAASQAASLTGLWSFSDSSNPGLASVGPDLTFAGSAPGTWSASLADDSGNSQQGVITTPAAAASTRFSAAHGIPANGGGLYVNQYSLLVDLFSPPESRSSWRTIFQTNTTNSNDADYFINPSNSVGVSAITYSTGTVSPSSWNRLVVTFDLKPSGPSAIATYLNGSLFHTHTLSGGLDGRFSLDPVILFFSDEDGDNAPLHVSSVAIWDGALSPAEVAALGSPGLPIPEPATPFLAATTAAALFSRRQRRPAP